MSATTTINILMTGAGAPGAPGILMCLQCSPSFEIVMADANPNAVGRWLHAEFETIPRAEEKGFIEELHSICQKRKIHVLLPLVTKELMPLATHKKQFEESGTEVLVSNVNSLEIANNKSRLYQFLERRGIDVPAYRIVQTADQLRAVEELGFPHKRVCFKPSISNGSRGFRIIANDMDEH
ncbi:MAG TPA: hypothetical protein VFP87_15945, partial [Chitinophagaceae bacterium]|nr:hypothetical protein [Chitinophagaceae bacterium]